MDLRELQRNWDILGKEDPLWAIITWADKKGNKWDLAEFFASGEHEIGEVMQYLSALQLAYRRGRALDFGCGVGRLTRALAGHFSRATGNSPWSSVLRPGYSCRCGTPTRHPSRA